MVLQDSGGYLANDSLDTSKTLYYPTTTETGPGRINPASFSASSRPQSAPNLSHSLFLLAQPRLFLRLCSLLNRLALSLSLSLALSFSLPRSLFLQLAGCSRQDAGEAYPLSMPESRTHFAARLDVRCLLLLLSVLLGYIRIVGPVGGPAPKEACHSCDLHPAFTGLCSALIGM